MSFPRPSKKGLSQVFHGPEFLLLGTAECHSYFIAHLASLSPQMPMGKKGILEQCSPALARHTILAPRSPLDALRRFLGKRKAKEVPRAAFAPCLAGCPAGPRFPTRSRPTPALPGWHGPAAADTGKKAALPKSGHGEPGVWIEVHVTDIV